eukprot:114979-Chlamydomonas_euryale.AAC.1
MLAVSLEGPESQCQKWHSKHGFARQVERWIEPSQAGNEHMQTAASDDGAGPTLSSSFIALLRSAFDMSLALSYTCCGHCSMSPGAGSIALVDSEMRLCSRFTFKTMALM